MVVWWLLVVLAGIVLSFVVNFTFAYFGSVAGCCVLAIVFLSAVFLGMRHG